MRKKEVALMRRILLVLALTALLAAMGFASSALAAPPSPETGNVPAEAGCQGIKTAALAVKENPTSADDEAFFTPHQQHQC